MLVRVNRHSGEIKKVMTTPVAKTAADGSPALEGEHKIMGIETRVLVAAGLLGVLTYGMFAYDPVPRKPKPKKGLTFGDEPKDKGYSRRVMSQSEIEQEAELEVARDEAEIDEEFDATDVDDEDEPSDEEEDEE
jgi:hypothetical protein